MFLLSPCGHVFLLSPCTNAMLLSPCNNVSAATLSQICWPQPLSCSPYWMWPRNYLQRKITSLYQQTIADYIIQNRDTAHMQCMNFVLVYLEAVKNIVKLGWTNILKQNETGGEMRINGHNWSRWEGKVKYLVFSICAVSWSGEKWKWYKGFFLKRWRDSTDWADRWPSCRMWCNGTRVFWEWVK